MRIPVIRGIIDRRILVNYRIDADVLARVLPEPFRPQLVGGFGIAGICLIRLKSVRPRGFPAAVGIGSENAAHRIAVEWDDDGQIRNGVYIPRRDTSSRWNALAGGRLFPGMHHLARFHGEESGDRWSVEMNSLDGTTHIAVSGRLADRWPDSSVFESLAECSAFFESGSLGYSPASKPDEYDGLELRSFGWNVEPLDVERVESSVFEDERSFPVGSVEVDAALLMRNIEHEWHERPSVRAACV